MTKKDIKRWKRDRLILKRKKKAERRKEKLALRMQRTLELIKKLLTSSLIK